VDPLRAAGLLMAGIILLLPVDVATAGYFNYEDAEAYYRDGYLSAAQEIFRQLADRGDVQAQYRMGRFYKDGEGVTRDDQRGCDWFERAANRGYDQAMFELGHCFFEGEGRPRNINAALYLYSLLAEKGLPEAQYRLARIYAAGSGVRRDPERAYVYLFLALGGDMHQEPELTAGLESELDERQLERAQQSAMRLLTRQAERAVRKR
jgi:TPR repeat protein